MGFLICQTSGPPHSESACRTGSAEQKSKTNVPKTKESPWTPQSQPTPSHQMFDGGLFHKLKQTSNCRIATRPTLKNCKTCHPARFAELAGLVAYVHIRALQSRQSTSSSSFRFYTFSMHEAPEFKDVKVWEPSPYHQQ